ncbi:MAG: hypothetical protein AB7F98_18090, partial [Novosphingobium sp.]
HYLRTGINLTGVAARRFLEHKFNPYHDSENGQFTFAPGGAGSGNRVPLASRRARAGAAQYPVRVELPSKPYPVRIELPESKPLQPRPKRTVAAEMRPKPPRIRFARNPGLDLDDQVISKANALSDAVRTATGHQIHVTSSRRGPGRQADAMYNNYLNRTAPRYANKVAEAEVHRAYNEGIRMGLSRDQVIMAMANVLSRQNRRGIYISRHMRSNAIDIRTPPASVLRAIRNHPMVQSVLTEDDHIHIQFK